MNYLLKSESIYLILNSYFQIILIKNNIISIISVPHFKVYILKFYNKDNFFTK